MKSGKVHILFFFIVLKQLFAPPIQAQICQHPTDSVYAMTTTGTMYALNVNNALLSPAIPASTSTGTLSANGLGYSVLNGKFYYFNKVGTSAAPSPQFVSYDPVTTTLTTLPAPPATITSAQKIRSGCVNHLGSGYYTINPIFNPTTPALYYYNIATATWATVTSSFVNPSAVSLNSTFNSLNSGDMAFDGKGNLWILLSNAANYALYKIAAPVPTTPVASVTAQQMIAPTATPGGVSITGLAFNASGVLYLSTGAGVAPGNNLLYKLTTVSSGLTLVGTIPINDVGADLTECSAPLGVLPSSALLGFTAVAAHNEIDLSWTAIDDENVTGYIVETSKDAEHWIQLQSVDKKYNTSAYSTLYTYKDNQFVTGKNFYRVIQVSADDRKTFSAVRLVNSTGLRTVAIGPNPAKDIVYIYNAGNEGKYLAQVFDRSGKLVYTTSTGQTQQEVNISRLPKGSYILRLSSPVNGSSSSHQFIKW